MLPPSRLRRVLTLDENLGDTRHYLESPDGVTTIHEKTNGKKSSVDSLGGDKMAYKKPVSERERELELEFADFVQWLEFRNLCCLFSRSVLAHCPRRDDQRRDESGNNECNNKCQLRHLISL